MYEMVVRERKQIQITLNLYWQNEYWLNQVENKCGMFIGKFASDKVYSLFQITT